MRTVDSSARSPSRFETPRAAPWHAVISSYGVRLPEAWRHSFTLALVAVTILFTNLGKARLWDRDEPRNAGCAAEMMARGDWIVPVFNGELRDHKPILLYWLMLSAFASFGNTEFAARFWSAALSVGTVLLTYQIGRRLFHARAGWWAGLILASTLMFPMAGRAATPDSVLIFFSTASIAAWILATRRGDELPTSRRQLVVPFALMGFAVLAKGPVGLVLPMAVIGMYLLVVRAPGMAISFNPSEAADRMGAAESTASRGRRGSRWRWLATAASIVSPVHFLRTLSVMRPGTALVIASLVAVPWYAWVGIRTDGEWLRGFFFEHNLGRATRAMEGHSGPPVLYYAAAILVGFFPWSILAGPTLIDGWFRLREREAAWRGCVFCACWVGVYVGLFSLARTKLPSYVTPCYPALALMTGAFVSRWLDGSARVPKHWPRYSLIPLAIVGLAVLVGLPLVATRHAIAERWLAAIGAIPLITAVVAGYFTETNQGRHAAKTLLAGAVVMVIAIFDFGTVVLDRHQTFDVLLAAVGDRSAHPEVGAFGVLEPTWVFYGRRPIQEVTMDADELQRSPPWSADAWQRGDDWHRRPKPHAHEFLAGNRDRFVVTTKSRLPALEPLPAEVGVVAELPYFLKRDQLIVIGRRDRETKTDDSTDRIGRESKRLAR